MTDPVLTLASAALTVEPGGQVQTTVTINNPSEIVEGFRLTLLGDQLRGFGSVTPAEVQIFPGQESTAVIMFQPPAGNAAPSGTFPFGLRVESVIDADSVAVVEGDLEIGRVFGLTPKVVPVTSAGRWRGRHLVTLSNWGNSSVQLKITAADPDDKLAFLVLPDHLDLPVGASGSVQVQVRTRAPFLRGTPTRLPFQVVAEPDPPDPRPVTALSVLLNDRRATVDAAFLQRPIISRTVVVVLTGLLVLLGGGLAYALTRPPATPTAAELVTSIPDPPALTASPGDQSITLVWTAQPGIESYRLYEIIDGNPGPMTPIDGGQSATVVGGLAPATEHCYQLLAQRGQTVGPLSSQACATTNPAPVTPASESAAATSEAPVTSEPVGGTPLPTVVVPPVGGGGTSTPAGSSVEPSSSTGTAATTATTATTGTTTGGEISFTPTQHIAVLAVFAAADADAASRAETRRAEIESALAGTDFGAAILQSADYPGMLLVGQPVRNASIYVYVGPLASGAAVTDFCADHPDLGTTCVDAKPQPGG